MIVIPFFLSDSYQPPDQPPGLGIETDRRLVHEDHLGTVHQAARDQESPPHAAGEMLDSRVLLLPEPDEPKQFFDSRAPVLGCHPVEPPVVFEVFSAGKVDVEVQHLRDDADGPLYTLASRIT